jgi:hypothetical protein
MNKTKLSKAIQVAFSTGQTYEQYFAMNTLMAKEGRTTGVQKPSYIEYTKLSAARMRRWNKVYEPDASFLDTIKSKAQLGEKWLVFSETWCGDAAHNLPFIAKWASHAEIDLRIILRDEHPYLMEEFLTNGGRSIPKFVRLNHEFTVLGSWGPRPLLLMEAHAEWKNRPEFNYKEWVLFAQDWYNKDKGAGIENDFEVLMD